MTALPPGATVVSLPPGARVVSQPAPLPPGASVIAEEEETRLPLAWRALMAAAEAPAKAFQAAGELDGHGREVTTALSQGATWNWGDEATSAMAAAGADPGGAARSLAAKVLTGGIVPSDPNYSAIYNDILESENARQREFTADRPVTSFGLEAIGALGTGRPSLNPVRQLFGTAERHAAKRAVAQAESTDVGGTLKGLISNMGTGITEGVIAGAGASEEDRMGGAQVGGAIGAALPFGMNVGRELTEIITRRRIAQELGKGDKFMPISMAGEPKESWISDMTRNLLGRGGPVRVALSGQERKVTKKLDAEIDAANQAVRDTQDAKRIFDYDTGDLSTEQRRAQQQLAADQRAALEAATARQTAVEAAAARRKDELTQAADSRASARTSGIEAQQARQTDTLDDWARSEKARIEQLPVTLRLSATRQFEDDMAQLSLPAHAKNARGNVAGKTPQEQADIIDQWYRNEGFGEVKSHTFQWPDELLENLRSLRNNPSFALNMGDVAEDVTALLNRIGKDGVTEIDGATIMALRNRFTGGQGLPARLLYNVRAQFDDMIKRQLPGGETGEAALRFTDELERYGASRNFIKATKNARAKGGLFDYDDWLAADTSREAAFGRGPGQKQAEAARERVLGVTGTAQQEADDLAWQVRQSRKSIARNTRGEKKDVLPEARRAKTQAAQEAQQTTQGARQETSQQRRLLNESLEAERLKNQQAMANRKGEARGLNESRIAAGRAKQDAASAKAKMTPRMLVNNPTGGQMLLAWAAQFGPAGIPLLTMFPDVQRTLAGQAGWQKMAQAGKEWAKKDEQEWLRELANRLRSGAIRATASNATEE